MELFHGSVDIVEEPIVDFSGKKGDLGIGFYLTSNKTQAEQWTSTKMAIRNKSVGYINRYFFPDINDLNVKIFRSPNEEWLDYVTGCRKGNDTLQCDLIIGPVADDTVFKVLKLYENGDYTKEMALERLKIEKTYDQYVFKNASGIKLLKFLDYEIYPGKKIEKTITMDGRNENDSKERF